MILGPEDWPQDTELLNRILSKACGSWPAYSNSAPSLGDSDVDASDLILYVTNSQLLAFLTRNQSTDCADDTDDRNRSQILRNLRNLWISLLWVACSARAVNSVAQMNDVGISVLDRAPTSRRADGSIRGSGSH